MALGAPGRVCHERENDRSLRVKQRMRIRDPMGTATPLPGDSERDMLNPDTTGKSRDRGAEAARPWNHPMTERRDHSSRIVLVLIMTVLLPVPRSVGDDGVQGSAASSPNDQEVNPATASLRIPPKEPAEAQKTFKTLGGFRLDLLAAEPLVTDPVAMEYDEDGRAYVVEMRDYPYTDRTNDKPFAERTTDLPARPHPPPRRHGRRRQVRSEHGLRRRTLVADRRRPLEGGSFRRRDARPLVSQGHRRRRPRRVRGRSSRGFRKFNVQAVMNNLEWGLDHGSTAREAPTAG